jgi:hypothetical protein
MSYSQHLLATDAQFAGRVASIMKDEGYSPLGESGMDLAWRYAEDIAAQPGLAESYHAALIAEEEPVEEPGISDEVITDSVLLSAVAAVMDQVTP